MRKKGGTPSGESQPSTTLPIETGAVHPTSSVPASSGKLKQLSAVETYDYFVKNDGTIIALGIEGQITELKPSGEASVLSATPIKNIIHSSFSYDGNKIALAFGEPDKVQVSVYDLNEKTWKPIDIRASNFDWSPKSYEIAYLAPKGDGQLLYTWNLGEAKAKPREWIEIKAPALAPIWTRPNLILLTERGSALIESQLWSFDLSKKLLSPLLVNQEGLNVLAQKNGEQLLVFKSSSDQVGGGLFLVDQGGKSSRSLNFLTLPSKCFFGAHLLKSTSSEVTTSTTWLSCAIPNESLSNSQLPDDYQKKKFLINDSLYQINLADGGIKAIFSGADLGLDISQLKISNQKIYFVNRANQRLYALTL